MPVSLQPAILKYKNSNGVYQTADCLKGDVDLGVIGASVGQVAKITAVDANGVPTAWAPVDSYPKKVFEYTFSDNWYKCSVSSIDYSTGVITLAANDAPFTDSYDTTLMVWAVPLIDGIKGTWQWGFMPPELYGINNTASKRGVLVGTNQIKIYTAASTSIDAFTEQSNVDLNRFQIWATDKKTNFPRISVTDLLLNHRYRIIASAPYGGECSFSIPFSDNTPSGSAYGNGYSGVAPGISTGTGNTFNQLGYNSYEAISFRSVKHYSTDDKMFVPFPKFIAADLFRVSTNVWLVNGDVFMSNFENKTISNITATQKLQFLAGRICAYLNYGVASIVPVFNSNSGASFAPIDGGKFTIIDMGEEYS